MQNRTLIITVNYRTSELLCALLASLDEELSLRESIFLIVDNGSGDDSVEQIENYLATNDVKNCIVLPSKENKGFSAGNNIALEYAIANKILFDYVWFLNPDTRLRNDAGEVLRQFLHANNVHIAGSRLEDEDGTWQCSHFNYPNVTAEFSQGLRFGAFDRVFNRSLVRRQEASEPCKADWLAGASFMMTRECFEILGLMDEEYFLYFEEVDYFLSAKRLGLEAWYVPESRVFHEVGASTKISDSRKKAPRRPDYWFESRARFYTKNYGFLKHLLADFSFIAGYGVWKLRKLVSDRSALKQEPPHFYLDFLKHSIFFSWLKK
ncbi:glycosyltransferase family 2 protein [Alteromonas sp. BMJM2]|uniref:glycosyltransferase family 2 protein n=1 Tax=Alteromonas sp. BMJM2 TaxID=2954241 RepID=UPI0022B59A95|nr:glycosyltransferase family 2 protein [Alteromonas sp. BMJM2]